MPWDIPRSIMHLQTHAGPPYGHGKCATFVRQAIEAGGLPIRQTGSGDAKDYGPRLVAAGFVALVGDPIAYKVGDVAVIDGFAKSAAPGIKHDHLAGHTAMFNGKQWISDYKQIGIKPYAGSDYEKAAPRYVIYRYPN